MVSSPSTPAGSRSLLHTHPHPDAGYIISMLVTLLLSEALAAHIMRCMRELCVRIAHHYLCMMGCSPNSTLSEARSEGSRGHHG